ncbi:MAG: tetratricopeptide repeat protein [Flavobacteriales bacterium]|nr:tetratricopeptide repeat protein [Flavobacteriales bacterium]
MSPYGKPFLVFALGLSSLAQAQYLDSLYTVWQDRTQADSNRVAAYVDHIWDGYLFSRPDTAAILAEALHAFAQERQYPRASAKGYNLQGTASRLQGDYPRAFQYYQKSLATHDRIGDKKGIAGCLNNIGLIYREQGRNERALEYYMRSLSIFEAIRDKHGIGNSLNNIGSIYTDQRNYPRALEYFERGTVIQKEVGNEKALANGLGNIGVVHGEQGDTARALEYFEKSLAIREAIGDQNGIAVNLNNIGVIHGALGEFLPRDAKPPEVPGDAGRTGGQERHLHEPEQHRPPLQDPRHEWSCAELLPERPGAGRRTSSLGSAKGSL